MTDKERLASQRISQSGLNDNTSPQQFNPTILNMRHYSSKEGKSLDYIQQPDEMKEVYPNHPKNDKNMDEYNKI